MTFDWVDYARAKLMVAGLNRGAARERIIDLLGEQHCALSVTEIEDILRARGQATSRATIYRVLDLMVEHRLVERVVVGEGQARFEPVDPGGLHHHHLVCDSCGELVAFNDTGLERAISRLSDRLGVRVKSHEVTLHGSCGRCN